MTRSRRRRAAALAAIASAGLLVLVGLRIRTPVPPDAAPAEDWTEASAAPPPLLAGLRSSPAGTASAPPPEEASAEPPIAPSAPSPGTEDEPELPAERVALDVVVVDPAGDPVPRAKLVAVWGEWRTRVVAADAKGKATLRVPRGTRALEVVGAGPGDPRPLLFVHYHPLGGTEPSTRVVVRVGSAIDGRLVDADGTPIAGAVVRTVPAVFGFAPVRTDPDGKSRLGALQGQRVDVRFDGEVPAAGGIVVDLGGKRLVIGESGHTRLGDLRAAASVLPGSEPILLRAERVTRRADLEVRVVADGRPLEGAHVIAFPSLPYEPGPTQVETDLSGRAVLRGLPVWPTDVLVKWIQPGTIAHGGPPNLEAVLRAPMEADAMPGGPPLVVRMERVAVLRGRVVDPSGEPVAKAWCGACEGASCVAAFPTDAEGRFTSISNVAPGTRLQISARFPMDRPVACGVLDDVLAGEGELRIVLRPVPGR